MLNHTNNLVNATASLNGKTEVIRLCPEYTIMEDGVMFLDAIEMLDPFHPENRRHDAQWEAMAARRIADEAKAAYREATGLSLSDHVSL